MIEVVMFALVFATGFAIGYAIICTYMGHVEAEQSEAEIEYRWKALAAENHELLYRQLTR